MKENIELNKAREFGDVMGDSFVIIRQNFKPLLKSYLVICGLFLLTGTLLTVLADSQQAAEGENSLFSFWGLVKILFEELSYSTLVLTVISYLAVYQQKGNQPATVVEVWEYVKYYFFRVLGTQVLLTIALGFGFLFCFVPGIYLAPVFGLVLPVMIIENANAEYAIKKSFKIIKQNWWLCFGVILLTSIIVLIGVLLLFIPALLLYGGSQWLTGKSYDTTYFLVQSILEHLSQFLLILPVVAITLVYFSLIEYKEASNLVTRIKNFGKKDPSADQFPTGQY